MTNEFAARLPRSLTACVVLGALLVAPTDRASAAEETSERSVVLYQAPVTTPVVDPFRPPAHVGGAGNRGLEYGLPADGQVVTASASGSVTFAGPVAGRTAITIEHADGVRTSYTGLLEVWVQSGQYVENIHAIGIADSTFHFGARIRDHYLDPQILIDESVVGEQVRLVPDPGQ